MLLLLMLLLLLDVGVLIDTVRCGGSGRLPPLLLEEFEFRVDERITSDEEADDDDDDSLDEGIDSADRIESR